MNARPLEGWVTRREMLTEHSEPAKLNLVGELNDALAMRTLIATVRPDRILHLAGQSFVPASWSAPAETFHVNVIGQIHVSEAVLAERINPLIHVAGSNEEYGLVYPEELPIKETNRLRPLSPYGVSKIAWKNWPGSTIGVTG